MKNPARMAGRGSQEAMFQTISRRALQAAECHDVGDLDHGVDRRAGSVLVRIADRIARYSGLVGFGALAAVVAVLDVLLRVVPGAAARGHRKSNEEPADDHAKQQRAKGGKAVLLAADE